MLEEERGELIFKLFKVVMLLVGFLGILATLIFT